MQRMIKMRRNYFLGILIVIMVFFAIISMETADIITDRLRVSACEHYQLLANNTAEMINSWLSAKKEILENQRAALETTGDFNSEYLSYYLRQVIKERKDSNEICDLYFVDTEGVLSTGNDLPSDVDLRTRVWYKSCIGNRRAQYTAPYRDSSTDNFIMTISVSCNHKDGSLAGVLAIDIFINAFMLEVNYARVPSDSYVFLIDNQYGLASHPNEAFGYVDERPQSIRKVSGGIYLPLEEELRQGSYGMKLITDYDGVVRDMFMSRIEACRWFVVAAVSDHVLTEPERMMTLYFIGALFVSLAFGILWTLFATRRMMKKLKDAMEQANIANQTKSRFLANMSHEIRTPINAILGMNEMVLHQARDPVVLEYSNDIKRAGKTLVHLVNDILDFSKIESDKLEIVPVEYDLAALIGDIVRSITPNVEEKGLTFSVKVDGSIPSVLYGDDVRIRQVIMNFLTNAVKYTHEGSVTMTILNRGINGDGECLLHVSVKDTGIGIREEDKEKVFETFSRLEENRNRAIEGTGLGMSITTRLMKRMGGTLGLDSVYGQGSNFYFELRQKVVDPEPIGDYSRRLEEASARPEKPEEPRSARLFSPDSRVLVVDDNEMNRKVAGKLLMLCGITADMASSGREAIEMARETEYDLIFMDHMMPEMDGVEALQQLKTEGLLRDHTRMVALTANAIVGARERYLSIGFDDYLTKPIEMDMLLAILSRFLSPEEKLEKSEKVEKVEQRDGSDASFSEKSEKTEKLEHRDGSDASFSEKTEKVEQWDGSDVSFSEELEQLDGPDVSISEKMEHQNRPTVPKTEEKMEHQNRPAASKDLVGCLDGLGLDTAAALAYCADSPELYEEVLQDFVGIYEEKKKELDQHFLDGNMEDYTIQVHAIKSMLRTIGASELSGRAAELEKAARDREVLFVEDHHQKFMKDYGEVTLQIGEVLKDQGSH